LSLTGWFGYEFVLCAERKKQNCFPESPIPKIVGCPLADALCACKQAAYKKSNDFGLLAKADFFDRNIRRIRPAPKTAIATVAQSLNAPPPPPPEALLFTEADGNCVPPPLDELELLELLLDEPVPLDELPELDDELDELDELELLLEVAARSTTALALVTNPPAFLTTTE
jgi:hypothetical protein